MNKNQLRQKFITLRHALAASIVARKSEDLVRKILDDVDWSSIHTLHCFLPLSGDNEPDMRPVIEFALNRGITVYTSNPSAATGRRVLPLIDSTLQSQLKQYTLQEEVIFELVIVPMIAYDPVTNHRLGFGGGFYDRLLQRQQSAQKIGVCFVELTAALPEEPHDVALDKIIVV